MASGHINGPMDDYILVNIKIIRKKDTEFISMHMAMFIWGTGKMGKQMDQVFTSKMKHANLGCILKAIKSIILMIQWYIIFKVKTTVI